VIVLVVIAATSAALAYAVHRAPCNPPDVPLNLSWIGMLLGFSMLAVGPLLMPFLDLVVIAAGLLCTGFFLTMVVIHGTRLGTIGPVIRTRVIPPGHPEES
jgi:hypothetical protein